MSGRGQHTESLCPTCLRAVPAELVTDGDTVTLVGGCPLHGEWRTSVWVGPPSMESWCGDGAGGGGRRDLGGSAGAEVLDAEAETGLGHSEGPPNPCPGSCGLCEQHRQHTCTALLEVTRRCDLGCPICFAESVPGREEPDPSLEQMGRMLGDLFADQGAVNLQLSGGEPTVRDDLPDIVRIARGLGFTFIQLNTNGLRLAAETGYAEELGDAGLDSVFLQFDGVTDSTYRALRGRPLAAQKMAVLERCAQAGLAVVLVPTVVPGVNDQEMGDLVRLATQWPGVVRGVHLQPVSYFGRFASGDRPRLTLPEALRLLERQTAGVLQVGDFAPSCCEHLRCSFRARYWVRDDGSLELVRSDGSCCGPKKEEASRRAIKATSRQWGRRPTESSRVGEGSGAQDGFDRLLDDIDRILCISGMLFQDAWSIDLERVRQCCVHVMVPERGLVPFCLWNLTSASGERLYPRIALP